jgi:hypothetical protein
MVLTGGTQETPKSIFQMVYGDACSMLPRRNTLRGARIEVRLVAGKEPDILILVRFESFTAVGMKNAVSYDIRSKFVPHMKHITSPLQSPAS